MAIGSYNHSTLDCAVQAGGGAGINAALCICQPDMARRSQAYNMSKPTKINTKWMPILQARASDAGVTCHKGRPSLCDNHTREFRIGAGVTYGAVKRKLEIDCCALGHKESGQSLYWTSKKARLKHGFAEGSQICGTCRFQLSQDKENPQSTAKKPRMSAEERRSRALAEYPKVDHTLPPTHSEREYLREVVKKFNNPELGCLEANGRIRVFGTSGGTPTVLEVVTDTRKSSVFCSPETVKKRTRTTKKRRLSGCAALSASVQEAHTHLMTYTYLLAPVFRS